MMSNVSLYKETLNSSAFSFPSSPFLNSYEDSFEMMLGAEVYKQHIYIYLNPAILHIKLWELVTTAMSREIMDWEVKKRKVYAELELFSA